ncbi:MAG: GNAT family N-acetyltransferase [Bacteroidota bacterium]|nr:GNAT family N-acetyltransferase [Bacteroidota bacterium]
MNFLVRKVLSQDAEKISLLSNQLGYPISASSTLRNIEAISQNENEIILVAQAGDELAGWLHVFRTIRVESGMFGEIGGLVVSDRYRRKGAGKMLVERAKQWCILKSIPSLRVRCNSKRKEAHEFYAALGFTESKEQKVFETSLT